MELGWSAASGVAHARVTTDDVVAPIGSGSGRIVAPADGAAGVLMRGGDEPYKSAGRMLRAEVGGC